MLHDQYRVIRRAEGFFLGLRQRRESVGNEGHGELAALLNFQRVVDTPRRAGPSITETGQHEIRLARQLLDILFRRPLLRRQLAPRDHVGDAVPLL